MANYSSVDDLPDKIRARNADILRADAERGKGEGGAAKGSTPKGVMNGLEAAYAAELELRRQSGLVVAWGYERVTLKLAPRTTYTPDFDVIMADMTVELHETKGFLREDANLKFKIAAAQFPFFRFVMLKKKGSGFEVMRDSRA